MSDQATENVQTPEAQQSQAISAITFNNRTYTPEQFSELQGAVTAMEKNVLSDYTRKLESVKAERAEVEKRNAAFAKDVEFYNKHPEVLTAPNPRAIYEPLSEGGRGLIGRIPLPDYDTLEPTQRSMPAPAFDDSPKLRALEADLARQKALFEQVSAEMNQIQIDRVVRDVKELRGKYPNAIPKQVENSLQNFFNANGRHPNRAEVEDLMKLNHEEVAQVISAKTKGVEVKGAPTSPKATTPPANGGGTPVAEKKTAISMDDPKFIEHIMSKL